MQDASNERQTGLAYQAPANWDPLTNEHFASFLVGLLSSWKLLTRAAKQGAFLEYVCLATVIVDAQLRAALVLDAELRPNPEVTVDRLVFQREDGRRGAISERDIYRISLGRGLLSSGLHHELMHLYDRRNSAVHRYVITRVSYDDIRDLAVQFEMVMPAIREIVQRIEFEHITAGTGMVLPAVLSETPEEFWQLELGDKHGSVNVDRTSTDHVEELSTLATAAEEKLSRVMRAVGTEIHATTRQAKVEAEWVEFISLLQYLARYGHVRRLLSALSSPDLPLLPTLGTLFTFDVRHSTPEDWTRVAQVLLPLGTMDEVTHEANDPALSHLCKFGKLLRSNSFASALRLLTSKGIDPMKATLRDWASLHDGPPKR
jgi:hypothetical protein